MPCSNRETKTESILDDVECVRCRSSIDVRAADIECARCGQVYPRVGRIPVLLPRPDAQLETWRRQLAQLIEHARRAASVLESAAQASDVLPDGRKRLCAMSGAARQQTAEFLDAVGPSLGGPLADGRAGLPRGVVDYCSYLYRDWGWPDGNAKEIRGAVSAIRAVAGAD